MEKKKILNNFNFTVNPGEMVAIMGESGIEKQH